MDAKWWRLRTGGNSLARTGNLLGPESGVTAAKFSDKGILPRLEIFFVTEMNTHTPHPGVREANGWCWEESAILGPAAASNQQGESADQQPCIFVLQKYAAFQIS